MAINKDQMLGLLRKARAIEAGFLLEAVRSGETTRREAAQALLELGPDAATPEVLSALREWLEDDDSEVRQDADAALACLGTAQIEEHPSLLRFWEAARSGWRPEERAHVSRCEDCQRTLAVQWRVEHPNVWSLVQYEADPQGFADRRAMQLHLERDRCRRCRVLRGSGLVAALAQLLRAGQNLERMLSLAAVNFRLDRALVATSGMRWRGAPPLLGPPGSAKAGAPAADLGESAEALEEETGGELQFLRVVLDRQGELGVVCEAPDPARQPAAGLLEVAGESGRQSYPLEFEQQTSGKVEAEVLLGAAADAAEDLGREITALAAVFSPEFLKALEALRRHERPEVREAAETLWRLAGRRG